MNKQAELTEYEVTKIFDEVSSNEISTYIIDGDYHTCTHEQAKKIAEKADVIEFKIAYSTSGTYYKYKYDIKSGNYFWQLNHR